VPGGRRALTASERDWLRVRHYLRDRRHELAVAAASPYPAGAKIAGTPLLAAGRWRPAGPLPLTGVDLVFRPGPASPRVTGSGEAGGDLLPLRGDGTRYRRYSEVLGALAAPAHFEDRPTYRLLEADLTGPRASLVFGRGSYFDGIDTGEASAHEYAAERLGVRPAGLRAAIGDPCDLAARPVNLAISTLTIRRDREPGRASMLLHWRDPAKVAHAGGLYQVIPVGVFQPSGYAPWNEERDFGLWRCMIREFSEELLGDDEDHGSEQAPIDYGSWPFARELTGARDAGRLRAYCLGLGTDPLTFATDLLTAVVIDAPVFDDLFGGLAAAGAEGRLLAARDGPRGPPGWAFTADTVGRFAYREPMQAAGAALLALAWRYRSQLLS
jgi:hypothetical protein